MWSLVVIAQDTLSETKALSEASLPDNIVLGPVTFNLVPKHAIVKIHFLSL